MVCFFAKQVNGVLEKVSAAKFNLTNISVKKASVNRASRCYNHGGSDESSQGLGTKYSLAAFVILHT